MKKVGSCNVQYANHLFGKEALVLRGDRLRSDNPILEIFIDDNNIVLRILQGISLEQMRTDPNKGAKKRMDIHFEKEFAADLLKIVRNFADENKLILDSDNRRIYDPTGTEHQDGLRLGATEGITSIPSECNVYYFDKQVKVSSNEILVDKENYPNKKRVHIGSTVDNVTNCMCDRNYFEIVISSKYIRRFEVALNVACKLLES